MYGSNIPHVVNIEMMCVVLLSTLHAWCVLFSYNVCVRTVYVVLIQRMVCLVLIHHPCALSSTLQHTATHCNTLQHTAAHCNTLQHTATHCSTLQHTATHCSTLQHTATHCNTLQHTATHCSTLQHSMCVVLIQRMVCVDLIHHPFLTHHTRPSSNSHTSKRLYILFHV